MWAPPAAAKPMEAAAGMESPNARKTWGGGRADVDSCGPAKPMQTAAGLETPDARKTWGGGRADVGNSGAVKLMKIAAAKAAVESAAGKTGGDGRGAGAEIRRGGNAAGAKATKAGRRRRHEMAGAPPAPSRRGGSQAWVNGVRRPGMRNDHAMAMMAPDRGAAKGVEVEGADPPKTIVPLVAALIPAAAVPPVPRSSNAAAELDCLHRR